MQEKIKLSSLILDNEIEDAVINAIQEVAKTFDSLPEEEKERINIVFFIEEKFKERFEDYDFAYKTLIEIVNSEIDYRAYQLGREGDFSSLDIDYSKDVYKGEKPIWIFDLDREMIYKIMQYKLGVSLDFSKAFYDNEGRLTTGAYSYLEGLRNIAINEGNYFNFHLKDNDNSVEFIYTEDKKAVVDFIIEEMRLDGRKNFLDILNGLTIINLTDGYISHGGAIYNNDDELMSNYPLNWKEIFNNDEIEITDLKPYGIRGKMDIGIEELLTKYGLDLEEEQDLKLYIPSLDKIKEVAIKGLEGKEMRGPRI